MRNIIFAVISVSLLLNPCFQAAAQTSDDSSSTTTVFDTLNFPQWARDLRRWDIIAFGSFPFSMFFVTFLTDMIRWNNANNMDFSAEGRRYAPWPFKSAGAVEMTNDEYARTILLAAGLSVAIAFVDLIIVRVRRNNERRRIESLPSGTVDINRGPYGTVEEGEDPGDADDTVVGGE
jgi:hypothetical protein